VERESSQIPVVFGFFDWLWPCCGVDNTMMRWQSICVVGGAGFIGSNLCLALGSYIIMAAGALLGTGILYVAFVRGRLSAQRAGDGLGCSIGR
jgi:hypothetical protein